MKRDMDLIRSILLTVEGDPGLVGERFIAYTSSDFPGYSQQEIDYHIDLLFEAGLVAGMPNANPRPLITKLTWQGHEFVSSTRDPDVWSKVKERTKGLPDIALSVTWELAKAELKKKLGLN
jgi:Hypothetical protein (DUF2513)